jgi:hypothetical protein
MNASNYYLRSNDSSATWVDINASLLSHTSSLRAPIFYDLNNTGYYVDPASVSYLYGLTLAGGSYFRPNNWIQFDSSYGLYWPNNNNAAELNANTSSSYGAIRLVGSRNGWDGFYSTFSAVNGFMYDSAGNGGAYREANSRWYWYYHLSNDCMGIGTSSTSSTYSLYLNKGVYAQSRIDATIFYDSSDTTYYIDPASFTNVFGGIQNSGAHATSYIQNRLLASNNGGGTGEVQLRMWCSEPNVTWDWAGFGYNVLNDGGSPSGFGRVNTNFGQAYMRFGTSGDLIFYNTTTGASRSTTMQLHSTGYVTAFQSSRAPIFYDLDDTGYYIDPASTSNTALRMRGGALFGPNTSWGQYLSIGTNGNASTSYASVATTDGNLHLDAKSGSSMYLNYYAGSNVYFCNGANTIIGQVSSAGNAIFSGNVTAYGSPSDRRLKENIQPIKDALATVLRLSGCTFDWKENTDEFKMVGLRADTGFIADEVRDVIPSFVREDENGYLSLRDRGFAALLVEAIKELSAKVDALR